MKELLIEQTRGTPGIKFSPDDREFFIRGSSFPEDVRTLYYPVLEWVKKFTREILNGEIVTFNEENPIRFQFDLKYFHSTSAKFFFDILMEFKKLPAKGIPFIVEWYYEEDDPDMHEDGVDFSKLTGMEFTFIPKHTPS